VLEALGDRNASLEDLLAASRAQANALAEMENALEMLKADLAAGTQAAQAAEKAAVAVAEAMEKHQRSGGGRGAADNTDEILVTLKANILDHIVPEVFDTLVAEGKLTRKAVTEAKDAAFGS